MPAIPHVVRRGAFYYWRRRLPSESRNSATLILGLGASNPRRARFLAGQISALADRCFFPAAMTSFAYTSPETRRHCEQNENYDSVSEPAHPADSPMTAVAYLEKLNAEQRRAVEHGLYDGSSASAGGPLLFIAGAGSGKTNTPIGSRISSSGALICSGCC